MVFESKGHLHIHTTQSDGAQPPAAIARDALAAGLDFLITTDHNVWVEGVERYHEGETGRRVLLLVGEEVHDVQRRPQGNHCLIFGADTGLAHLAGDPQQLIHAANEAGGFCFIAHPFEIAAQLSHQGELDALNWDDWGVDDYAGLEIWNYMSEFKSLLTGPLAAIRAAYHPERYITGPFADTIEKWDQLLSTGRRVSCLGGSDAHGNTHRLGPLKRTLFPYEFHFRTLNTHLLTAAPLTGDFETDKQMLLRALQQGNGWVGYDAAGDTTGFRFSAQGLKRQAIMGQTLKLRRGFATLQVTTPAAAHIQLVRNGEVVAESVGSSRLLHQAEESGVYRAQVFTHYAGQKRGWIYSNPIYVQF